MSSIAGTGIQLQHVAPDQFLIISSERLRREPSLILREVLQFIGVTESFLPVVVNDESIAMKTKKTNSKQSLDNANEIKDVEGISIDGQRQNMVFVDRENQTKSAKKPSEDSDETEISSEEEISSRVSSNVVTMSAVEETVRNKFSRKKLYFILYLC